MSTAVAHANIALAKYWGKSDVARNLPAVPSLSLTLDALSTHTTVELDPALETDAIELDGAPATGRPRQRVVTLLDRLRSLAGDDTRARVTSSNTFPTAAGLASSASGFAALAVAADAAYGAAQPPEALSALAREASVSAARSLFGGFVALPAGAERAERVAPPDHLDVAMVIALCASGPKAVGSTEGMLRTAETSPYYAAWVAHAPRLYADARRAVLERDLEALGPAVEQSALMMHASMLAARPAILYFMPATLAALARVRELRSGGVPAYATMDAGPHVKVLTGARQAVAVAAALEEVPGVQRVLTCRPGGDAHVVDPEASR